MAKKKPATLLPQAIETALGKVKDQPSFIKNLLIDTLAWPIDPAVSTVEDITYEWSKDELKAQDLDKRIVDGKIRQIALPDCPWGIFIVEFNRPDILSTGRGMTVPLRKVLAGLVPKQRKAAHLPSFFREHLLFICTYDYKYFRFVHFKDPGASFKQPTLASFGWWPGDSTKTVCTYNLPHLAFLDSSATVDQWLSEWTSAFDVERVTKRFYEDYKAIHALFRDELSGVKDPAERTWLASVLLNRLMFVYFLQKKGFLDGANESYLEDKLKEEQVAGKNKYYTEFLTLLFFEGFAKPPEKRTKKAIQKLGTIRYLNGGLFLEHPIEQKAREGGKTVNLPDSVFVQLFKLFASFSWNLNDKPGGQDNEINPDVLGYIVEKYINQKAFGAYYTRPEITGYLCERTIHRLILDAVNTPEEGIALSAKAGLPVRSYKSVADLLKKLDPALATKLLDDVLPNLALLDPACGSGAFLVAAMKTLIDIYAAIFGWTKFNGSSELKGRLKKIESEHASLDYFIKKRIITDNLFGVDIMEEAVEIARLRLFLALASSANSVEELEPLPNIDFNILRGNSLIGLLNVDHKRAEATGKTGHLGGLLFQQKSYADVLLERNRQLDVYRHFSAYADDLTALRDRISAINSQAQNTLDELLLADFEALGIKFEQATWDDSAGEEGKPQKRALSIDDIRALHPFHWAFAFDKVMARGGFDAIITNPPWEIFKPQAKEFFKEYSDLVIQRKMDIKAFEKEQAKLLRDNEIRTAWFDYLNGYAHVSSYFRAAATFKNQSSVVGGKRASGDINLYKLFIEQSFNLLRQDGACGIVVPTSIYTDLGAKQLREILFDHCRLDSLFGLSNERFIFEGVDHRFKVCLLTFQKGGHTSTFNAAFRTHPYEAVAPENLEEFLHDPAEHVALSVRLIRSISPDSLSIWEFANESDINIANKTFLWPPLGVKMPNRWNLSLYNELHMTNDSDVFSTRRESTEMMPLYEGKMIHYFRSDFAKPRYWVSRKDAIAKLKGSTRYPKDPWAFDRARFAHRSIGRSTDSRTLICTLVPPHCVCGHSLNVDIGIQAPLDSLFAVGLMSSLCFDYALRQQVSANLTMFFLYQTPAPRLASSDGGYREVVERSAKLICTTSDFDVLASHVRKGADHSRVGEVIEERRLRLRCEIEAIVAHLYRLSEAEFSYVLSSFPLVESNLKQGSLEEFKRLQDSGQAAMFNPDLIEPSDAAAMDPSKAIHKLISAGENVSVEFKSTARWDVKLNQPGKHLERVIVKTVAALLNTQGGTLIIGVEDNGNIYGLAEDFRLCGNKGRDGFELWLMQTLLKDFGKDASAQISIAFHELKTPDPAKPGSGDVCVLSLTQSPRPRFVIENNQELFFIRTGNATNQLKPSEMIAYCQKHWPDPTSA